MGRADQEAAAGAHARGAGALCYPLEGGEEGAAWDGGEGELSERALGGGCRTCWWRGGHPVPVPSFPA